MPVGATRSRYADKDRKVETVTAFLSWWDGVELWLSGLSFVAQTVVVMPAVLLIAGAAAVVLDGALGNGIRWVQRATHRDEDPS